MVSNMQKRFDEYFAKVILESCFPEKFSNLQIADTPDLRYGNCIGIEVTNCIPNEVAEAFSLWNKVAKQEASPRILERLEQLSNIVYPKGDELIWEQRAYSEDNIVDTPVQDFICAV